MLADVVERVFQGSREQLLVQLLKQKKLTAKERAVLRELIQGKCFSPVAIYKSGASKMNTLTSTLLWMSVQVALFSLVGCGLCLLVRRCGPRTAATCTAVVLGLTLLLAAFALSPWPRWTPNVPSRAAAIPRSANEQPMFRDHRTPPQYLL